MPASTPPTVIRAIGRWSLAALTVNCVIASGVFGLPSIIAGQLGSASPFAWIFAAVGTGLVMACFAEVASRFEQSGGVYLYSRQAFGRTTGIAVAWIGLLTRLTAMAANASLFMIYLEQFWHAALHPISRTVALTLLLGFLTVVNYSSVRRGTNLNNLFTACKLITLGAFIAGGLFFVAARHHTFVLSLPAGPTGNWLHAVLLLMFAYGGFETALMPGGEVKDPRRDYPFALLAALITCTLVYTMTQWVVMSVVPFAAMTDRPVATAVQIMIGPTGAAIVSIMVLISCYGYLSANILGFPRLFFALAEQGDLPSAFARVHRKFRTPHVAIVSLAACALVFALAGSFEWNLEISAAARLVYYASVCAALPVLRHKPAVPPEKFHLPLGNAFAVLAIAVSLLLFPRLDWRGILAIIILGTGIAANSIWARRRAQPTPVNAQSAGTQT
jgi:basic amino acid/polyamine antiporter, APA family